MKRQNYSIENKSYDVKHKRILQKASTKGDTCNTKYKKEEIANWRITPGQMTDRRKLINEGPGNDNSVQFLIY
jgi:hypothetical protein